MKTVLVISIAVFATFASAQTSVPTRIRVDGTINCAILVGGGLRVTGDNGRVSDEVLARATQNGVLDLSKISSTGNFQVSIPKLTSIDVNGTSNVSVSNIDTGYFDVTVSGTSNVALDGTADYYHVKTSGASNVALERFTAHNLHVWSAGMSNTSASGRALGVYLIARSQAVIAVGGSMPKRIYKDFTSGSNISVTNDD